MSELKPCPFCGGDGEMDCSGDGNFSYIVNGYASVRCSSCGSSTDPEFTMHDDYSSEQSVRIIKESIEKWNTRSLTPKQQCADEMYEMLDALALDFIHSCDLATAGEIEDLLAKSRGEL